MAERKFTVKLDVNNIGPHFGETKLSFSDEVDSNKAIIYATNGTGKSFISRAFRLTSAEKRLLPADDLLTLGQPSGNLSFSILDNGNEKKLSVGVERGIAPIVTDSTGLLFHVFNSDYVEENIKPRHFTPDGHIEGYILGKTQIDLTDEKRKEAEQDKELKNADKAIDSIIEDAQRQLREKGVVPTTTEFALIDKIRLRNSENVGKVEAFEVIAGQLEALEKIPERIADVVTPVFHVDTSSFEGIEALLSTEYPSTDWDESFVADIKAHRAFIEDGLRQIDGDENPICPFCKQTIEGDTLTLIRNYKSYLADKEAETLRLIESYIKVIEQVTSTFSRTNLETDSAIVALTEVKKYFPSLADVTLRTGAVSEDELSCFASVKKLLEEKSEDLSKTHPEVAEELKKCNAVVKAYEERIRENAEIIKRVNTTKSNANGERLSLRRNLCKAQYRACCSVLAPLYADYDLKAAALKELQDSIIEKEQKAKVSKKEKVYETLTDFLNRLFAGKYSIDKDSFQIRFLGKNIGDKASSILSDGEKSIVAFCYYLASTHLLVEREDDYNKLFFVIDDPISSMDFHYVYAVAQSLRDIKEYFGITAHDRIWVLTHNIEFLSIVSRNFIISRAYVMKPGKIEPIKHQLLMPYESHLKDIVDIASGNEQPSHTTANSIRHVLETVSRFEYPQKELGKYIAENAILSENSCIFTLCQDLSHGRIRNQPPFSAEVLTAACKTVVAFMSSKYEGQVNAIPAIVTKAED